MGRSWLALATLVLAACDPYERFVGESSAGAVDAVAFPPEYLGENGDGTRPGLGTLEARPAYIAGAKSGYYAFSFAGDLDVAVDGVASVPLAYDFDDSVTRCVPPESYAFDPQRDAVRFDEQGNIFTRLPSDPAYAPVVADVTVTPDGLPCQDTKSAANVVGRTDVSVAQPSGRYFSRAIIDPSIDVRFPDGSLDPITSLGPQRWGWYQRYLLAYLDGGELPTLDTSVVGPGGQTQRVTQIVTQPIYFPSRHPDSAERGSVVEGALGDGYDLIRYARGENGYSALCEVVRFDPVDPMSPETDVASIDLSTTVRTGTYVWCIQVRP